MVSLLFPPQLATVLPLVFWLSLHPFCVGSFRPTICKAGFNKSGGRAVEKELHHQSSIIRILGVGSPNFRENFCAKKFYSKPKLRRGVEASNRLLWVSVFDFPAAAARPPAARQAEGAVCPPIPVKKHEGLNSH
jgi:hypothetical protein